ncbi:MAG: glucose 1-dehydrogenase [Bacteroidota bacterium]
MQSEFKDKVVLITGAGSGIGKAAAMAYAERGAKVVVSDIHAENTNATAEAIKAVGGESLAIPTDVSSFEAVKELVDQTVTHYGSIDIALNNAGIGGQRERTSQFSLKSWDQVIAVNQSGVFYCMREQLRYMEQQGSGCIVNIASIAGLRAFPMQVAYSASKFAVVGMTRTAAGEYAKMGIRINAVCPVFTHTPMVDGLLEIDQSLEAKLVKTIPMRRFGEVSDMVNAILWLSSEGSSFITGLALPVDGGQMM